MNDEKLKLSNQALGTLMMSLQKCLMEQTDITEILKDLDFYVSDEDEIVCLNPPAVEAEPDDGWDEDDDGWDEDEDDEDWDEDEEEHTSEPFSGPGFTKVED